MSIRSNYKGGLDSMNTAVKKKSTPLYFSLDLNMVEKLTKKNA